MLCGNLELGLYATKKRENNANSNHTVRRRWFMWFGLKPMSMGENGERVFTIRKQRLQWTVQPIQKSRNPQI